MSLLIFCKSFSIPCEARRLIAGLILVMSLLFTGTYAGARGPKGVEKKFPLGQITDKPYSEGFWVLQEPTIIGTQNNENADDEGDGKHQRIAMDGLIGAHKIQRQKRGDLLSMISEQCEFYFWFQPPPDVLVPGESFRLKVENGARGFGEGCSPKTFQFSVDPLSAMNLAGGPFETFLGAPDSTGYMTGITSPLSRWTNEPDYYIGKLVKKLPSIFHLDAWIGDGKTRVRYTYKHRANPDLVETRKMDPCGDGRNPTAFKPMCAPECQKSFWRWRFWVTNYNVSRTMGQGEHQGIGIFGFKYSYDPRFPASMGATQPWVKSTDQDQFERRTTDPGDVRVTANALCKMEKLEEIFISNHGRTLARRSSSALSDLQYPEFFLKHIVPITPMDEFSRGPLIHTDSRNPYSPKVREIKKIEQCINRIDDGFCDSVCGNCSYVMPKEKIAGVKSPIGYKDELGEIRGHGDESFAIREGAPPHNVIYLRGGTGYWTDEGQGRVPKTAISRARDDPVLEPVLEGVLESSAEALGREKPGKLFVYDNPFTHCDDRTDEKPDEGITTLLSAGTLIERVITGLFGHNSNTDAEAEFKQFGRCGREVEKAHQLKEICEICGKDRGRIPANRRGTLLRQQWPCIEGDETNEAKSKWKRTDGLHNIWDDKLGKLDPQKNNPPPTCAVPYSKEEHFWVYGM